MNSSTFTKPLLDVDAQIALLINRGMEIPERKYAQHHLRHINYYRLRACWLPFEKISISSSQQRHAFIEGTSFEKVLVLFTHPLSIVRNHCAHHGRIGISRFSINIQWLHEKSRYLSVVFNLTQNRLLYNILTMLVYF